MEAPLNKTLNALSKMGYGRESMANGFICRNTLQYVRADYGEKFGIMRQHLPDDRYLTAYMPIWQVVILQQDPY